MTHRFPTLATFTICLALFGLTTGGLRGETTSAGVQAIDIPAGSADVTLKLLASQSHTDVVFATSIARNVTTNAVKGNFEALQAASMMVAGTKLTASLDEKHGAIVIGRKSTPAGESAPLSPAADTGTGGHDVVLMDAFEVTTAKDNSYGAENSNSLTSFNIELNKLPVSADIFDQTFINDVGATDVEDMIEGFAAGAGMASSTPASVAGSSQQYDRNAATLSLRGGLTASTVLRDGFFPSGTTSVFFTTNFDLQEVDVVEGPQSLLYGAGGAGGVLNLVSKQANFNSAPTGELKFQVDQYGNKEGTFDYGMGSDLLAVRVALVNQTVGGRRENVGGPLTGDYVQIAAKPLKNTIVRVEYEQTYFTRFDNQDTVFTAASTSNDARNGDYLHYLLATNQIDAAANGGPSGAGVIDNGKLNWGNVDSLAGAMLLEDTMNELFTAKADTVWTPWLSTEVATGYEIQDHLKSGNMAIGLDAPNVAANTTGTWADSLIPKAATASSLDQGSRTKDLRVSALLTNDLFGSAHSQTVLGADTSGDYSKAQGFTYVLANSSFQPVNNGSAVNGGLTIMPSTYWSVANGPVEYPFSWPSAHVTIDGQNYVRIIGNPGIPSLMTPGSNPLGLTGDGLGSYRPSRTISKGVYFANFTDWFDGRLSTLFGARAVSVYNFAMSDNASTTQPSIVTEDQTTSGINYNAGINYRLLSWLRPYAEISDTLNPPLSALLDPYGNPQKAEHAVGEETGFKVSNAGGTLSGSVAIYNTDAKDEETAVTSTIIGDINPPGLNGRLGGSPSTWINVNRESQGLQATFTANPVPNWRLRLTAAWAYGTNESNNSYAQLYNDQFNENSQGQVTYKDGTVVYVSSTTSKPTVTTAGAAGAEPLTVSLMSTPSSIYYANPAAVSGAINSTSGAATILLGTSDSNGGADPLITQHGPILTGAVGLPISQIQINPGFTPPGIIPIAQAGDITQGYPQLSCNLESMYTFASGPLKGLKVGGLYQGTWKYSSFYYYPNTLVADPLDRKLFSWPTSCIFTGIIGYEWKLKRVRYSTQLNIDNIFNSYKVVITPNYTNGYAGPDDATFSAQPRSYVWSNRIDF